MIKITPYIAVHNNRGVKLEERIDKFTYKYSEEYDDECILTLCSDDPLIADDPNYQEGSKLLVEWGYLDSGESMQRTVYIFETKTEYTDNGINLTLTCHEKFALTKMNQAGTGLGTNKTSKDNTQVLVLGATVLNALHLEVLVERNNTTSDILREAGIEFDLARNEVKVTSAGWFDDKTSQATGFQPNQNVGISYKEGSKVVKTYSIKDDYPDMVYFLATASSYKTLRKYLDKLPGGPYVIDSRDDTVIIRTRNFNQDPVRVYTYKGGDGELLSFTPETKNRQNSKGASRTSATSWDAKSKTGVSSTSTSTSGTVLGNSWSENELIKALWSKYPNSKPWDINEAVRKEQERKKAEEAKLPRNINAGKPLNYNGGFNALNHTFEQAERDRAAMEAKYANDITPEKLGGNRNPTPESYDPNDQQDGIQFYKPWEMGGREPARLKKSKGLSVGTTSAIDNTSIDRRRIAQPLYKGDTPGVAKQLGNEGSGAQGKAEAYAKNSKEDTQLENNPATATMVGNPFLQVGSLITITNVSKKHEGNYYLKEVEHQIGSDGYMVDITKMVRQGTNKTTTKIGIEPAEMAGDTPVVKQGKDYLDNVDSGDAIVNTKIGPPKHHQGAASPQGVHTELSFGPSGNIITTTPAKEA